MRRLSKVLFNDKWFITWVFSSKRGLRQGDSLSTLLFVLCIEYLSRILRVVGERNDFKYHPRCRGLSLTHLCFADDIILCCKGELKSVKLLMKGFYLFSKRPRLYASPQKTAIYCCGVEENVVQDILRVTGFSKGLLPFRYLGLPICSKKISIAECEHLVEKMSARIKIWSSKHLSFSRRLQLVNSVLLSIQVYCGPVMVLPKTILKSNE